MEIMKKNMLSASKGLVTTGILIVLSSLFTPEGTITQTTIISGLIIFSLGLIIEAIRYQTIILENIEEWVSVSYSVEFEGIYRDEDEDFDEEHTIKFSSVLMYNLGDIPSYDRNPSKYVSYIETHIKEYVKAHSTQHKVRNGNFMLDITSITKI